MCSFVSQLKTPKEKENFAKKLTELHRAPSVKELADLAVVPPPSRHHQHIEERQQLWKELSQGSDEFEQQLPVDAKEVTHHSILP